MLIHSEQDKPTNKITVCKIKSLFSGLTIILAVAAIIVAFYTIQLNQSLKKQVSEISSKLSSELDELKQSNSKSQEELNSTNSAIQKSNTQLQDKFSIYNMNTSGHKPNN